MRVRGRVKFIGDYDINIDITEKEFYKLSFWEQSQLIESHIDANKVNVNDMEINDDAEIGD